MKERPILFSGPMVRAILADEKTMTRRIVMPQPAADSNLRDVRSAPAHILAPSFRCPFGVPGDRLWVRETHATGVPGCQDGLSYRADHQDPKGDGRANPMRWTPAIHMRRAFSRIDLEVTAVRVERLQDITEEDARAEGVRPGKCEPGCDCDEWSERRYRQGFEHLWDVINGKKALWSSNPWVWVVSFKRVRP